MAVNLGSTKEKIKFLDECAFHECDFSSINPVSHQ